MKVLVCGGRDYNDPHHVFTTLDELHAERQITHLIHGAASGADELADQWATTTGIQPVRCPALWKFYGAKAGPRRNRFMLDLGPTLVVAFPGGRGTANMLNLAKSHSVPVVLA